MAPRMLSLPLVALCLSAGGVAGMLKSGGGEHHHDASAADGLCPNFAAQNVSEFRRVCIEGGLEEAHAGARRRAVSRSLR